MKNEIYFKSSNKKNDIRALIYDCEKPTLIVQMLHGMCEHIERYEEFAEFLNAHNIIFAGNDHLGHGKSTDYLGYFGTGDTIEYAVDDVNKLSLILKEKYDLPIVYIGHSMGSFILRYYISKYNTDKIVLMGTGYINNISAFTLKTLSSIIALLKGEKYTSKLLVNLTTNKFARMVKGNKHDWISFNEENIKSFENDPYCNFDFTVNGYKTLANCLLKINNKNRLNKSNKSTEILFISGAEDPVGNFKKGVLKVYKIYKNAGFKNIKFKFLKNMRHEILNEKEKDEVYKILLDYLKKWLITSFFMQVYWQTIKLCYNLFIVKR